MCFQKKLKTFVFDLILNKPHAYREFAVLIPRTVHSGRPYGRPPSIGRFLEVVSTSSSPPKHNWQLLISHGVLLLLDMYLFIYVELNSISPTWIMCMPMVSHNPFEMPRLRQAVLWLPKCPAHLGHRTALPMFSRSIIECLSFLCKIAIVSQFLCLSIHPYLYLLNLSYTTKYRSSAPSIPVCTTTTLLAQPNH